MEKSRTGFIKFNANLVNDYELKPGEALVYAALVSFRNMSINKDTKDEQGQVYAYPPISSIAKITTLSVRSVTSHIQVLEQKGLMTVKRSYKEGSKEKNVNRYYLNNEVLEVYFPADTTKSIKTAKPKISNATEKFKESKQKVFIADTEIEKWFTHYKGEHNNNSAKKLNQFAEDYGADTVIKAIHNAMKDVSIDTLPNGTTGIILSRLNEKNLRDAKHQLQIEKEKLERFMNEEPTNLVDYAADLERNRSREITTSDDLSKDLSAIFGKVLGIG